VNKNDTTQHDNRLQHAVLTKILCGMMMLSFASCEFIHFNKESRPQEPYAARAYEKYLYLSELQKQFPGNMSAEDSMFWMQNYINLWVQEQLFLHQAITNLSEKEQNFTQQMEAYKNSLLRYAYEIRLINQNLDTLISNSEIDQYYNEHFDDYILSRNVVKAYYTSVWIDATQNIKELKKKFVAKPINLDDINYYCEDVGVPMFHIDTTQWLYLDDVLDIIPVPNGNSVAWLTKNRPQEFTDSRFWYYIVIMDYRLQNERAPLELVRDRIQKTILIRRKEALLKDLKRNIYEDAKNNESFEIF
jgi:hypothetical protein